jgi:sarcosine oxidase, subunit gamma
MSAVIAETIRRSALADYADRFAALNESSNHAISIHELPFLAQIDLRVDPTDEAQMKRLASVLGFELPLTPNTVASIGDWRALWLGPDEWLIVGEADQARAIEQPLRQAVTDASASIVDVSANRTVLLIQGERARELLAHGIAIDLHPHAFAPGRCAQTFLANAQVIIERRYEGDAFDLFLRGSYSTYVADRLLDAAADQTLWSGH